MKRTDDENIDQFCQRARETIARNLHIETADFSFQEMLRVATLDKEKQKEETSGFKSTI